MSWSQCTQQDVFDEVTKFTVGVKPIGTKGIRTKTIPAKLVTVKKPLHDGKGGWKARAPVVCCGHFEPGPVGKDLQNRAEVPHTFQMRALLALCADRAGV